MGREDLVTAVYDDGPLAGRPAQARNILGERVTVSTLASRPEDKHGPCVYEIVALAEGDEPAHLRYVGESN